MKFNSACLILSSLALSLSSSWVFAQEGEDGSEDPEVTIMLIPEDADLPDAVTRELALPRNEEGEFIPSDQGVENSAAGLETANAAREDGRAFGAAAAEAAQDNREEFARGSRPDLEDLRPDQVPDDVPGPPESPGRP